MIPCEPGASDHWCGPWRSKRRVLPINSGWQEAARSDRPPQIGFAQRALHSRQSEEVAADAAEQAPPHIAADSPEIAPGSPLAVAVSSR